MRRGKGYSKPFVCDCSNWDGAKTATSELTIVGVVEMWSAPEPTPQNSSGFRPTKTIPIVFVGASDPVGAGYVESLARPGRNITGFTLYEPSLAGKWIGVLKEILPGSRSWL